MCFLLQTRQLANLQGYKENSTGEKSKTRFYLLGGSMSTTRSTPQPNGPGQRKKMSCHLVLYFRTHKYSALMWKDQFYYQSMGSEFIYDFGKVLGTQNYPTRESASTHCVLHLNLIKYTFNIAFYTHTHTHQHTFNMASNIPKP